MPKVRESAIERAVKERSHMLGVLCIKLWPFSAVGIPDRLLIYHGSVMFMELKTTDGVTTKRQRRWHAKLKKHGFKTAVPTTEAEALAKLENFARLPKGRR